MKKRSLRERKEEFKKAYYAELEKQGLKNKKEEVKEEVKEVKKPVKKVKKEVE